MNEVDPKKLIPQLQQFNQDCAAYSAARNLWRMPNYFRVFFRYEKDTTVIALSDQLEALVEDLSNSRDNRVIAALNEIPILVPDAHTRPFRNPQLNNLIGILFPIGIVVWIRIWRYRLRLWRDMEQLQKQCTYIIERLKTEQL